MGLGGSMHRPAHRSGGLDKLNKPETVNKNNNNTTLELRRVMITSHSGGALPAPRSGGHQTHDPHGGGTRDHDNGSISGSGVERLLGTGAVRVTYIRRRRGQCGHSFRGSSPASEETSEANEGTFIRGPDRSLFGVSHGLGEHKHTHTHTHTHIYTQHKGQ